MKNTVARILKSADARIYYWCLGVTVLWRLCLEAINQTVVPYMSAGPDLPGGVIAHGIKNGLLRWTQAWDASWYSTISQHGYVITHNFKGPESVAFFPLFPYVVKWLALVVHTSPKALGLLLNIGFVSILAFYLYKLTELMAAEKGAKVKRFNPGAIAVILLLVNPASFFFAAYYADALLALLVTASIYFAYKDAYILAALLAGLATATKSIGLVLLPTLLVMYTVRSKKDLLTTLRKGWLKMGAITVLSISGILAYMAYLGARFAEPLAFIKVEKYWDRQVSGFFLKNIWDIWYAKAFNPHYFGSAYGYLYNVFLMSIPVLITVFVVYILIKHRLTFSWLAVMCAAALLVPLSTGTLLSLNRYILLLTPAIAYIVVYIYSMSVAAARTVWAVAAASCTAMIIFMTAFLSFHFAG